jgi:hypothetical protein
MDEIVAVLYVDETTSKPLEVFKTLEELAQAHPWSKDWSERATVLIDRETFNKIKELANE